MRVLSLFSGAGGLDLGFEAAGFGVAAAVEFDATAVDTLSLNRDHPVFCEDIHSVGSGELLGAGELKSGEVDVLIGGPPCQPFSKSAFWKRGETKRLDDPRASTLEQYLRVLRDIQPRAFLLENVPGLGYRNKDEGLQLLHRTIADINEAGGTDYRVAAAVLNAADFGVPQDRKRLFLVGARDGAEFTFPEATHAPQSEEQRSLGTSALPRYSNAWDAIGDLEGQVPREGLEVTGKWASLLPSIPEGENYLFHTDRGGGLPLFGWRTRYWSFLLKLSKRLPSWTITAQPGSAIGPFHWENRRLSILEMARLQTFPHKYRIVGGWTAGVRQLGNAVPSALAETLARAIAVQLLGREPFSGPLTLIPQHRHDTPEPELALPVQDPYRSLIGDHADHPGTGKGPAAQLRTAGN